MKLGSVSKNSVLIFGKTSFTSKHLSDYLIKNNFDISYANCDITKIDEVEEVLKNNKTDFIINLAAISFVGHSNISDFYNVNVVGVTNILESLIKLNYQPKKIILSSSAVVYGNQNTNTLDESLCPNPQNHYGISKYAMECIAKTYFNKLNIIITRPFNYIGIGQNELFLVSKIIKHYKNKDKTIYLGNLDVSREFNDVKFVCECYKRLLQIDKSSIVVNIASNQGIKLLDIIENMNNISGYKIDIKINQEFVRKNEIKILTGSNKKLFELIGVVEQKRLKERLKSIFES
jgi:nucleoside-diphosphate-sugar epimerase